MRDLAIQASRLFLELFPSVEALSPCGRFFGSPSAGGGVAAGAEERHWGLGGPLLPQEGLSCAPLTGAALVNTLTGAVC